MITQPTKLPGTWPRVTLFKHINPCKESSCNVPLSKCIKFKNLVPLFFVYRAMKCYLKDISQSPGWLRFIV